VKPVSGKSIALAVLGICLALPAVIHAESDDVLTARNIINTGLSSASPSTRAEAIATVSMIAKSDAVRKRIEGFLSDGDVNVRITACDTLADLGFQQSIPALENSLANDSIPEVKFAAAKALYRLNDPKGRQALEDVVTGKLDPTSSYIDRKKRSVLSNLHTFHDASLLVLSSGGVFVPVPGAGMGMSEVARLLSDSALTPKSLALLMLGKDKGSDIDPLIRASLTDKDWTLRASAALIIALSVRKDMQPDIVPLLDDNEVKVRFRAAGAYLRLTGASLGSE
jgi:HEAT repeat protein